MAYDFQGTFTASQFKRLQTYIQNQVQLIDSRIAHLKVELERIGDLAFAYDAGGVPKAYANDPPTTYCGKLYGAYQALGGDVEYDLQVRKTSDPVFLLTGSETKPVQMVSNGEVLGGLGLNNATSAGLVQNLRNWVEGDLQRRRNSLERKIRRAIDYGEQLKAEINELVLLKKDIETEGSLGFYFAAIENLKNDRQYLAITNDEKNLDPHGKGAYAPEFPYMPGPKGTPAASYGRSRDGFVVPEQE